MPDSRRSTRRRFCLAAAAALAGCSVAEQPARVAPAVPTAVEPLPGASADAALVATSADRDELRLAVWSRAAAEQGVPLVVVDETALDNLGGATPAHRALILPDGIARTLSDAEVAAIERFVAVGGTLLAVFDAGTLMPGGFYAPQRSRLSRLVGVDYAMYDRLLDQTFRNVPVHTSPASVATLGIPPGKTVDDPDRRAGPAFSLRLATYNYPRVAYPIFASGTAYDGDALLRAEDGQVVAGLRRHGRGRVIFANLPLAQLKLATDGWLLHRFLRLLAREAALPALAMTPDAIGGMVMNLHCDSNAALRPLQQLDAAGFFDDGPFSVHVTAGPGLNVATDGLGIDVPHNAPFQAFLRSLLARGHEVGSHGGWIHNDWADHVDANSEARHAWMLERNGAALQAADGEPVRVYSSPSGNHPPWVTHWLRRHDYLAFYTTANDGAGPTRLFRDGRLEDDRLWSFPIMSLGIAASFEDAAIARYDEDRLVTPWLQSLARFAAAEREARLFYFHPTGVHLYPHALDAWVAEARALARADRYRWYTMGALSQFLDRREAARWRVEPRGDGMRIEVASEQPLDGLTWILPATSWREPQLRLGEARVRRDGADWLVTAASGRELAIEVAWTSP